MVVGRKAGHEPLGCEALAWIHGQAEFDLIFLRRAFNEFSLASSVVPVESTS